MSLLSMNLADLQKGFKIASLKIIFLVFSKL